ncbi:hypothetical protein [Lysinibacillus xylanilyticus]|uniref:hypothetical protein n=1 Tax=Lysinibacillus xylanilyticus TaxID=582475 RepID=UPI003CFFB2AA
MSGYLHLVAPSNLENPLCIRGLSLLYIHKSKEVLGILKQFFFMLKNRSLSILSLFIEGHSVFQKIATYQYEQISDGICSYCILK